MPLRISRPLLPGNDLVSHGPNPVDLQSDDIAHAQLESRMLDPRAVREGPGAEELAGVQAGPLRHVRDRLSHRELPPVGPAHQLPPVGPAHRRGLVVDEDPSREVARARQDLVGGDDHRRDAIGEGFRMLRAELVGIDVSILLRTDGSSTENRSGIGHL